jgi:aminoglycoside phosphotransferase (APT) family kinase protein
VELIARGREAEIFALDDRRVLRRYGKPRRVDAEHRLMEYVAGRGFPVPTVYEFTDTDMVMERLTGPTMAEALAARPADARRIGRVLGELHARLHAITAPEWLWPVSAWFRALGAGIEGEPEPDDAPVAGPIPGDGPRQGDARALPVPRVLHLDFHPANVILTARGPVVIDWSNAVAGQPGLDLAKTVVTLESADLPESLARVRPEFLRELAEEAGSDPAPWMRWAIHMREVGGNLTETEAARLRAQREQLQKSDS